LGRFPDARLVITGFGAYREGLELMVRALADGDLKKLRWLAAGGRAVENGAPDPLSYLQSFLRLMDDEERSEYFAAAAAMPSSMHWFGRLEHDLLTDLIPFTDAQIVPSTFPEAFGMVAAEAAACGVPPICANHSGLAEVTEILEAVVDPEVGQLLGFDLGPGAVLGLAARIVAILSLDPDARERTAEALAEVSVERFSWAGVARGVVEAASGRHDTLSRP
jgi:glycosyltransferase involved in cell wall biosynthesis